MVKSGQTTNNLDNRPTARVNGNLVKRAPRAQGGDKLHRNEDIEWLRNHSRGDLGEQGCNFEPGNGGRNPADNWHLIERMHRAMPAVVRWRRLNQIMGALPSETQALIHHRYLVTEREHTEVVGLRAAFSDLATLAWHLCDDRDGMRRKLSSGRASGDRDVTQLRNRANEVNRRIHREWLDAERGLVMDWAEG